MNKTDAWHSLAIDQTLERLGASQGGLSSREVERRLREVGPNIIPESPPKTFLSVYLNQFRNAFIYLLLVAAGVSLSLGEVGDALFIAIALQVNAVIGTVQEWQAQEKALALRNLVTSTVAVRRDGVWEMIDGRELVPGDIVRVEAGDRVPAAMRLLTTEALEADEALLTGESTPVIKDVATLPKGYVALADQTNMLHAGTTVMRGRATGVVAATGPRTEVGKVAAALKFTEEVAPPLIGRMRNFTHIVASVMIVVIAVIAFAEFLRGAEPSAILLMSVALAVAAIPEGLPVALTVTLAISVSRMAKRNGKSVV